MTYNALLLIALGLGLAFWLNLRRQETALQAPAPKSPVVSQPPTVVSNPGAAIVNMGSSIQKAQDAARLQTQSQARTGAAVSEAVEAR